MPLPEGAAACVAVWLKQRGGWSGPLFVAVDKADHICNPRWLSAQAVFDVCTKRAAEAGIALFSPHDMRRSYISTLLDAGADIAIVQRLVGHADPGTTSNYDRRPEDAKRKTAELLRIPFAGN